MMPVRVRGSPGADLVRFALMQEHGQVKFYSKLHLGTGTRVRTPQAQAEGRDEDAAQ